MITKNTLVYLKEELILNNLSHLLPIIDQIEIELNLSDQNFEQEHALTRANEAMGEFQKRKSITNFPRPEGIPECPPRTYVPIIQESNFRNGGVNDDDPGPRPLLRKRRRDCGFRKNR